MMFRDCVKFTPLPLLPQLEGFQDHIQHLQWQLWTTKNGEGRFILFVKILSPRSDQIRPERGFISESLSTTFVQPVVAVLGGLSNHDSGND